MHETTPSVFLQVGLELEEQQYVPTRSQRDCTWQRLTVCYRRVLSLIRVSPNSDKSAAEFQEKQTLIKRRIQLWQAIQDVHMPMVARLRNGNSPPAASTSSPPGATSSSPHPESSSSATQLVTVRGSPKVDEIRLWLPSSLPPSLIDAESLATLRDKERRLRLAQLSDSLEDIRRQRRILTSITQFKHLNVSNTGQAANTRIRSLYARFDSKTRRSVLRYRAARAAMEVLDPEGEWRGSFLVLNDGDVRGPGREDEEASEGRHEVSWIWLSRTALPVVPTVSVAGGDLTRPANASEFADCMRVEWARFRARVQRWDEEVRLLQEEMRRILAYCEHKAIWWREQGPRRTSASPALQQALLVYAEKQAAMFDALRLRCAAMWVPYLKTFRDLPPWAIPYKNIASTMHRTHVMRARLVQIGQEVDLENPPSSSEDESSGEESDISVGEGGDDTAGM